MNIFKDKWASDIVVGDIKAPKPSMLGFRNTIVALEMLHNHVKSRSNIVVHCDVDGDGIGCGYCLYKTFMNLNCINNSLFIINKEKEHGISERHVNYFNNSGTHLVIILDSSTNEIELIKQLKCDVLVIDHHEVLHDETIGNTANGKYVIINNMIDNYGGKEITDWLYKNNPNTKEIIEDYIADERMSCGLVLYELLRLYCEAYTKNNLIENLMLYQWVGVTLFTDAILLENDRNQWYIENTVHSLEVESTLQIMLQELNKFRFTVDKNFINFTLGPIINKAIRAGQSGQVLDIVLHRPYDIKQLDPYRVEQEKALENLMGGVQVYNSYALKDITDSDISKNYCGVIATKLADELTKNTVVYKVIDGIAQGSFRGRYSGVDYRKFFADYRQGIYAQGHKPAFGFKVSADILNDLMTGLNSIEPDRNPQYYLTMGNIPQELKGVYHVNSLDNFKRQGLLFKLAMANSKLSSEESLDIVANILDVRLIEQKGKLYIYDVYGLTCKAFTPLTTQYVKVYVEYSKEIELFVREIKQ